MKKFSPKFTIRALLLLMLVSAAATALWHRAQVYRQNRMAAKATPLNWQNFDQTMIDKILSDGKPVLVVYYSHWKDRPLWRLDTEEVRLAIFDKNVEIFSGNCHYDILNERGTVRAWNKIQRPDGESWFGAIYYPDSTISTFKWVPDAKQFASSAVEKILAR